MVHNPAYDLFSIGNFLCRVNDTNPPKYLSRFGLQPVTNLAAATYLSGDCKEREDGDI